MNKSCKYKLYYDLVDFMKTLVTSKWLSIVDWMIHMKIQTTHQRVKWLTWRVKWLAWLDNRLKLISELTLLYQFRHNSGLCFVSHLTSGLGISDAIFGRQKLRRSAAWYLVDSYFVYINLCVLWCLNISRLWYKTAMSHKQVSCRDFTSPCRKEITGICGSMEQTLTFAFMPQRILLQWKWHVYSVIGLPLSLLLMRLDLLTISEIYKLQIRNFLLHRRSQKLSQCNNITTQTVHRHMITQTDTSHFTYDILF